ncbi:hypothetical protein O181_023621 [Austropuccinia psidii MF-1]|uniref:Uncharacterized protein n=1 Tax=Austropuccinia psidii MF-1 TaxID=1389203 RepID=A0A9Q3CJR5_9BASI|nr:hypothetical protein [Austropuccinia psidii MF-1]
MKPQPQAHALDDSDHQEDIKPDALLGNEARSPSKYQDVNDMSYSEKEALKNLTEASSWPKSCGTGKLNTALKGHASMWYTEMKEIHGRRNWPWWKSQIIQKQSNGTWIWQKTMSFANDKCSVDKDPYYWCLRHSRRRKDIDPQINIQIRNHKLLTHTPGELDHAVKCRCKQIFTLDEISNTLHEVKKRTNIGKYSQFRRSSFEEKQPFMVDFKDKTKEKMAEVTKKKNTCHNCRSTDHYANNYPKAKKVYAIEQDPEEESPTEDSESESMGDGIRKKSDDDQEPREEFLVEYQQETQIKIQDIHLEAGMPQDTANKNLCKHTQDAQKFLVTPAKGMAYINRTATNVCIDNTQHPLIIYSGAHYSIVTTNYLDCRFPNWGKQLFPAKAKSFKSASWKMKSIGTIIKGKIIPHRKRNIRINPEFVVLEDAHIQGFLLGTDYQRMYGIDIYNSKDMHITIGTNKEKKFSLDIYQISTHDILEEPMDEFREGQFSTTLPSKQKLSLLKMLRKNRPQFSIG